MQNLASTASMCLVSEQETSRPSALPMQALWNLLLVSWSDAEADNYLGRQRSLPLVAFCASKKLAVGLVGCCTICATPEGLKVLSLLERATTD